MMLTIEEQKEYDDLYVELPEMRMYRPSNGPVVLIDLNIIDAVSHYEHGDFKGCRILVRKLPPLFCAVEPSEIVDAVLYYFKKSYRLDQLKLKQDK